MPDPTEPPSTASAMNGAIPGCSCDELDPNAWCQVHNPLPDNFRHVDTSRLSPSTASGELDEAGTDHPPAVAEPTPSEDQQRRRDYYEAKPHKAVELLNAVEHLEAKLAAAEAERDELVEERDIARLLAHKNSEAWHAAEAERDRVIQDYDLDNGMLVRELEAAEAKLERVAGLIDSAMSKKLLGKFGNYGEMLEAKNLLAEAVRIARNEGT